MRLREWTSGKRPAPAPLEGNVKAATVIGTLVWAVLFVVQLPFYAWYEDHGHEWWIWTCLAGAGLGALGVWYVHRRDAALRAAVARRRELPPREPREPQDPRSP